MPDKAGHAVLWSLAKYNVDIALDSLRIIGGIKLCILHKIMS